MLSSKYLLLMNVLSGLNFVLNAQLEKKARSVHDFLKIGGVSHRFNRGHLKIQQPNEDSIPLTPWSSVRMFSIVNLLSSQRFSPDNVANAQ